MWLKQIPIKQIRIITLCKIIVTFMRCRHYKVLPKYWNIKHIHSIIMDILIYYTCAEQDLSQRTITLH